MKLKRKIFYFLYISFFRFTPEDYRPYSLFFPWIRNFLAKKFLKKCGDNIRVKYNSDVSPDVSIGNNSELGQRSLIHAGVEIGNNVIMGPDVKIYTRNHIADRLEIPIQIQGKSFKKTKIENDVWIGANVVILPGITVGSHSILAAGSIVTKDVPKFAVIGGNPAKVIKFRNEEN